MYTHYSLFKDHKTVSNFQAMPEGGLPALLADLHRQAVPDALDCCCGIGMGTLHPGGEQVSFEITVRQEPVFSVILMTQRAVRDQAAELASEGNESAKLAQSAIAKATPTPAPAPDATIADATIVSMMQAAQVRRTTAATILADATQQATT
jgi:hypothetical protein